MATPIRYFSILTVLTVNKIVSFVSIYLFLSFSLLCGASQLLREFFWFRSAVFASSVGCLVQQSQMVNGK